MGPEPGRVRLQPNRLRTRICHTQSRLGWSLSLPTCLSRTRFKHPIFTMLTVLLNVVRETETLAQQCLAKDGRVSTRTTPIRQFWPKLVVTGFRSFPRIPRMIGPPKDLMRPTDDYAAG